MEKNTCTLVSVATIWVIIFCGFILSPVNAEEVMEGENTTGGFQLWMKYDKGYRSKVAELGQPLSIQCRISVNSTNTSSFVELTPELYQNVKWTFFKDEEELPNFWVNETLRDEYKVNVHSSNSFEYSVTEKHHRGWYKCMAFYNGVNQTLSFLVRTEEDKPQWPALIITIQIVILTLIFWLYERREKKKQKGDIPKVRKVKPEPPSSSEIYDDYDSNTCMLPHRSSMSTDEFSTSYS